MTTPKPAPPPAPRAPGEGRRSGSHWFADIATALLLTLLEAVAVTAGLYVAAFAAWDAQGGGDDPGTVVIVLLVGLLLAAVAVAVVSGRAFRRRAPVTGCVQALVCAALLAGAAGIAHQSRDHLGPQTPAPSSPYRGTYGQCFSGGDSHECPGG
ncbi:DUF6234 family protein [Streptomyces lavendulae]|uniref:DUF6234 family protein n=1 Tax=Streptomyces lavendulae TaxID=1914 RepID=UPI0036B71058